MKKLAMNLVVAALSFAGVAHADNGELARQIVLADIANPVRAMNLINWKIGEYQEYQMTIQGFNIGNMHKEATSEEGNGIWITNKTEGGMVGQHTTETLLDRADGHIIKMKQDGKEQDPPNEKIEVIKQETATITVPAGTFQTIHVTAKTQSAGEVELWANPRDITLDGMAKMQMSASGMPVSVELTKFGGR